MCDVLSSDLHYDPGQPAKVDLFNRRHFAHLVADTILRQPLGDPLVVSIVGDWGSGKTTALRFVHERLAERPCKIAEFNPWRYSGEDAILLELFKALVTAVDPDLKVLTAWQEIGSVIYPTIGPIAKLFGRASSKKIPGSGAAVEAFGSRLAHWLRPKIEKLREQARKHLLKSRHRVVVLIDDVDRLDASDAIALFRIIKLSADLPNTTFVLSMDEEHVCELLTQHIQGRNETGRRYIEKIVNVRLPLPTIPNYKLRGYALRLLQDTLNRRGVKSSESELARCRDIFDELIAPLIITPRAANSLANAYQFALGLLPGELNVGDLLILEGVRLLRPKLYKAIHDVMPDVIQQRQELSVWMRSDEKLQREEREHHWQRILHVLGRINAHEKLRITNGLNAWFPQMARQTSEYQRDEWNRDKRICASEYFWRYFSGCVQDDDVRDDVVTTWMGAAVNNAPYTIPQLLEHLDSAHADAFLKKLGFYLDSIEKDSLGQIALILAQSAATVSDNQANSLLGSKRQATARIAANAISLIQDIDTRTTKAISIIHTATDLSWCADFLSHLPDDARSHYVGPEGRGYWKSAPIETTFSQRVLEDFELHPPQTDEMVREMVWSIWRNLGNDATRQRVGDIVSRFPQHARFFLAAGCSFTGTPDAPGRCWSWEGDKAIRNINKIVDVKTLASVLETEFSDSTSGKLAEERTASGRGYQSLAEIAHRFLAKFRSLEQSGMLEEVLKSDDPDKQADQNADSPTPTPLVPLVDDTLVPGT